MNQRIYNYSIHLLARRDYSEFKLKTKLRSKKDNLPHEIDEVIVKLKENGLLREENYRRLFIRKWMLKGESEEKIRRRGSLEKLEFYVEEFKLIEKELGFDDSDSIEKLIEKKIRFKEIPKDPIEKFKLRDKILRYLISKGHCYEDSKKVLDRFLSMNQ
jgi:regulatory protein